MTKVVYNSCYGGFGLSEAGVRRYAEIKGVEVYPEASRFGSIVSPTFWTVPEEERAANVLDEDAWASAPHAKRMASNAYVRDHTINDRDIDRADPVLVQVVEELGEAANGLCASLRIEELPEGTRYRIGEYDGKEWVETADTVDWSVA